MTSKKAYLRRRVFGPPRRRRRARVRIKISKLHKKLAQTRLAIHQKTQNFMLNPMVPLTLQSDLALKRNMQKTGNNGDRTLLDIYAWSSVAAFSLACEGRHDVLVFLMQKPYLGGLLRPDEGCYAP